MAFSTSQSTSTDRLISETNNKLKQGFHNLCCKLDNLGARDYELFMACDSVTGAPVIVTYGYDSTGALAITYTNIDGTPAANTVTKCPEKDYELTNFQWFCDSTTFTEISRTDLYINGVFDSYIWQDIAGNVIPTPLPSTYTVGKCVIPDAKSERDIEKICYTTDNGITVLSGWKRFTDILTVPTNIYTSPIVEILDLNNNVVTGAVETKCPDYNYIPTCSSTHYQLNNYNLAIYLNGGFNEHYVNFSYIQNILATDFIVSDVYIDPYCNVTDLNNTLNPPTIPPFIFLDTFGTVNPTPTPAIPAGDYIFKRLIKTGFGFEILHVVKIYWDGVSSLSVLSTDTFSNSNDDIVNYYLIKNNQFLSVLDNNGTHIKYVDYQGNTIVPTGIIGACPDNLATKYTSGCDNSFNAIPFQVVCIDNGVTQQQAQLIKIQNSDNSLSDKFYTISPNPTEIVVNPTDVITIGNCQSSISPAPIGLEVYQNLGNITQNCSFSANEITVTYDTSVLTTTPIIVTLIGSGILGSAQFEVKPNTQESRTFKYANITGATISGASTNTVTVEFQLN